MLNKGASIEVSNSIMMVFVEIAMKHFAKCMDEGFLFWWIHFLPFLKNIFGWNEIWKLHIRYLNHTNQNIMIFWQTMWKLYPNTLAKSKHK